MFLNFKKIKTTRYLTIFKAHTKIKVIRKEFIEIRHFDL